MEGLLLLRLPLGERPATEELSAAEEKLRHAEEKLLKRSVTEEKLCVAEKLRESMERSCYKPNRAEAEQCRTPSRAAVADREDRPAPGEERRRGESRRTGVYCSSEITTSPKERAATTSTRADQREQNQRQRNNGVQWRRESFTNGSELEAAVRLPVTARNNGAVMGGIGA